MEKPDWTKLKQAVGMDLAGNLTGKKNGKPTSHRYNRLPLLPSGPGGVQRELVVPVCRCKDNARSHNRSRNFGLMTLLRQEGEFILRLRLI